MNYSVMNYKLIIAKSHNNFINEGILIISRLYVVPERFTFYFIDIYFHKL